MIKILAYNQVNQKEILARVTPSFDVEKIVADIIADVKANGDDALYRYCEKFDHAQLTSLEVSEGEFDEAMAAIDPDFLDILKKAAENIRRFHTAHELAC